MARTIRCGECGAANPLTTQVGATTQECQECGAITVIPPGAQSRLASDRPARRTPPPAPVNRRPVKQVQAPPPGAATPARAPATSTGVRNRPWWLRILAWVIALPLALLVIGIPARTSGYLTSQKLLDVIIKHELGRFFPVVVIIFLWTIATVLLVTLIIEIGSILLSRRKAKRASNRAVVSPRPMSRAR